jgi:hypothetical protein
VYATGLPIKVEIKRTGDDAGMLGPSVVESNEVFPIQRQYGAAVVVGKGEHCRITGLSIREPGLICC